MSVNKKYYYLKFKENYFDQDHVKIIESMENGYIYSLIIIKLYLKSLKYSGQLKMTDVIPYDKSKINTLAKVINHDVDHVGKAINSAISFGVMECISTGEIFMSDIQNFIGKSSTEGDRKRVYRREIAMIESGEIKDIGEVGQMSDERPPELEKEKEKELEKELEKDKGRFTPPSVKEVENYCREKKITLNCVYFIKWYQARDWKQKNGRPIKDWQKAAQRWAKKQNNDNGESVAEYNERMVKELSEEANNA